MTTHGGRREGEMEKGGVGDFVKVDAMKNSLLLSHYIHPYSKECVNLVIKLHTAGKNYS